jgi:hypothetical protein
MGTEYRRTKPRTEQEETREGTETEGRKEIRGKY